MKTLLLLEWMKVRRYRTFWVFILLFVIAIAGMNFGLFTIQRRLNIFSHGQVHVHLFDRGEIWYSTAWASGFSVLLLGLLLIVLITNEFTFRTHRQQVIEGLSREEFVVGKWLVALVFLVFAWLIFVGITLVLSVMSHPGTESLFDGFKVAGYFLLKVSLSLSVAFIFAIWLKRSGVAIALYLVYVLLLESIAGYFLNRIVDGLGQFLPLKAGGALVSNPAARAIPGLDNTPLPVDWLVLAGIAYLALFVFITVRYIRRTNL